MSKKARKTKIYHSFLVLAIALVVALGVVGVVRANVGGAADKSVDGLVACLVNNPDHKVCSALVRVLDQLLPDEEALGGTVTRAQLSEISVTNSLGLADPDNKSLVVSSACRNFDFPTTTSTPAVLDNRSQQDLLVTFADLHVLKAPTATIAITVGTSTVSSVIYNELATYGTVSNLDGLINRYVIATSTREDLHLTNFSLASSSVPTSESTAIATSTAFARNCTDGMCRVGN